MILHLFLELLFCSNPFFELRVLLRKLVQQTLIQFKNIFGLLYFVFELTVLQVPLVGLPLGLADFFIDLRMRLLEVLSNIPRSFQISRQSSDSID